MPSEVNGVVSVDCRVVISDGYTSASLLCIGEFFAVLLFLFLRAAFGASGQAGFGRARDCFRCRVFTLYAPPAPQMTNPAPNPSAVVQIPSASLSHTVPATPRSPSTFFPGPLLSASLLRAPHSRLHRRPVLHLPPQRLDAALNVTVELAHERPVHTSGCDEAPFTPRPRARAQEEARARWGSGRRGPAARGADQFRIRESWTRAQETRRRC